MQMTFPALTALCSALFLALGLASNPAAAQSPFSARIMVGDKVITGFELEQRERLLALLQAPGNPKTEARRTLIEDRLKQIVFDEIEFAVRPEDVQLGVEDMATSVQMPVADFLAALAQNGVDAATVYDFMEMNLAWSEYVQGRFLARARPSDDEIDRALGQTGRGSVQVQLAEVIIPITAQNAAQVDAAAAQISQITDYEAFSEAARRYSQAVTAREGGLTEWLPISDLPPTLRPVLLGLSPGQVTEPIVLGNAVGLFQLRGIREVAGATQSYSEVQYALIRFDVDGLRDTPQDILTRADRCDDLYGPALDNAALLVSREALSPGRIPREIALALARLDPGESVMLPGTVTQPVTLATRGGGSETVQKAFQRGLMLCGRTAAVNEDATREDVAGALTRQRLAIFAEQFLAQRRADTVIVEK